jgi:hypothetical protein
VAHDFDLCRYLLKLFDGQLKLASSVILDAHSEPHAQIEVTKHLGFGDGEIYDFDLRAIPDSCETYKFLRACHAFLAM